VAKSKSAKKRQAKRRAHEARAARHESAADAKTHTHLPKTGTAADNAYLNRRRKEDLLAFGEFRASKGKGPVIVGVAVGVLFALGILAWILFFI
jgi:hypothetical protein